MSPKPSYKPDPHVTSGCSGSAADRRDAIRMFAANCESDPIDVIIGDWMSEANMTSKGVMKSEGAPSMRVSRAWLKANVI